MLIRINLNARRNETLMNKQEIHDPHSQKPTLVGWIMPTVPHYRVPVINKLTKCSDFTLSIYSGQELPGVSVGDSSSKVHAKTRKIWNLRLSSKDGWVFYVIGWTKMITDRCRVIIITEASHNLTNWLLLVGRRMFGYKVVIMGHIKPWVGTSKTVSKLRKILVNHADGIIAYMPEGRDQALAWGVSEERVVTMGNTLDFETIDLAKHNVTPDVLKSLRDALGFDAAPVFLFVGRPTPPKRLDLAIEATLILEKTDDPVNLVVIGDSKYVEGYRALAGHSNRIVFLGEILNEERIAPYFALCTAVILPGAVGLTIHHAFAYDRPLITSRNAQHRPEIALAKEGVNTIFVEELLAHGFAESMKALTKDRELQERLITGSRGTSIPDQEIMVKRIAEAINKVAL